MNKDSDIIGDLMDWLFRPSVLPSPPSGDRARTPAQEPAGPSAARVNLEALTLDDIARHPLELTFEDDALAHLDPRPRSGMNPIFESGDLPAVQDHFESVIKRRLRQEIEQRPPLFPWETTIEDYPDRVAEGGTSPWLCHLKSLAVPAALPDDVLAVLLSRCQDLAHQGLQSGARLVQAVEELFPGSGDQLAPVARTVLMPAFRSPQAAARIAELSRLDYASATEPQRMALAMLTARTIFDSLEVQLSPHKPQHSREWQAEAGPLSLTVTYAPSALEVQVTLPAAGSITLRHPDQHTSATRQTPGVLVLNLDQPQLGQVYLLTILLDEDSPSLQFCIYLQPD